MLENVNNFLEENGIEFFYDKVIRSNLQDNSMICRYLIGEKVYYAKIFKDRSIKRLHLETSFMQHLLNAGMCVPELLKINDHSIFEIYTETGKISFIFMTELLGDGFIDDDTLLDIVNNVARMHVITSSFLPEKHIADGGSDYRLLQDFVCANTDIVSALYDIDQILFFLHEKEPQRKYHCIHADLYMANIVTRKGKFFGVIDFTDCKLGLFEDDLGKLFQNYLTSELCDINMIRELLAVYQEKVDYKVDVKEVYISCIYRILYNFMCISKTCLTSDLEVLQARYSVAIDSCVKELLV